MLLLEEKKTQQLFKGELQAWGEKWKKESTCWPTAGITARSEASHFPAGMIFQSEETFNMTFESACRLIKQPQLIMFLT